MLNTSIEGLSLLKNNQSPGKSQAAMSTQPGRICGSFHLLHDHF